MIPTSGASRLPKAPMSANAPRAWIGITAALITIAIWTSFIVVARASASHTLLPLDILALRVLGAAVILAPYAFWQRRKTRQSAELSSGTSLLGWSPLPLKETAVVGVLAGFLYSGLAYTGFFYAPATHASVLLPGTLPLWTGLLSLIWLNEKLSRQRTIGLLCILAGGVLVGSRSLLVSDDTGTAWIGDLLFLAASATWATYGTAVRKFQLDAVKATTALVVAATFVYLPAYGLGLLLGMRSHLSIAPWQEMVFQAVYQGGGTLVIAGITFNIMVKQFGPVRTTMMTSVVPSLSAISAVILLGEIFTWQLAAGLALVTSGILAGAFKR